MRREGAERRCGEKVGRAIGISRQGEQVGREGGERRWGEKVGREGGEGEGAEGDSATARPGVGRILRRSVSLVAAEVRRVQSLVTTDAAAAGSISNPNLVIDPPADIGYGERTDEEMCYGFSLISLGL